MTIFCEWGFDGSLAYFWWCCGGHAAGYQTILDLEGEGWEQGKLKGHILTVIHLFCFCLFFTNVLKIAFVNFYNFCQFFFLKDFIYLLREQERAWVRGRGRRETEGEFHADSVLSVEADGFNPTILRSLRELKSRVGHLTNWATQVP